MLFDFLKKLFSNKKFLLVFCFFILIAILIPLSTTQALSWDPIGWVKGKLGAFSETFTDAIFGTIFGLLMSVPLFLLNVALDLLNWVTSGDFLAVSFTGPDNHLVSTGWGFTRNLANVVLIFGLVIIALSIIMDYQETQAKKALVNFVLIAALINFTPVFCGLIIDLARIIMDLLLKGGVPPSFATLMASKMSGFSLADIPTLVVLCLFCLFSAVIYFLFALLFLVRIVMLWILIILSPIAFSTKVMPQGKMIKKIFPGLFYWDEWWDAFLQWCFLGIPAAIGIWLSNLLMFEIATDPESIVSAPTGGILSGTLALLFSYSLPFVVLVIFFMLTLDSGGSMGSRIKGVANKTWAATGGAVAGAATGYVAGKAGSAAGYARERAGAFGTWTREGVVGTVGGIAGGDVSKEGREKGRVAVIDWKQRQKERIAQNRVTGKLVSPTFATDKTKAQKDAEKYVSEHSLSQEDYWRDKDRFTTQQRLAYEEGYIRKDTKKYLANAGTPEEYERRMQMILRNDDKSKEYKRIKTKATLDAKYNNSANAGKTEWDKKFGIEWQKEVQKMSSKDLIEDISAEAYSDPEFIASLRTNQIDKAIKDGSGEITDNLYKTVAHRSTIRKFGQHAKNLEDNITNAKAGQEKFDAIKAYAAWNANHTLIENRMRPYLRNYTPPKGSQTTTPTPTGRPRTAGGGPRTAGRTRTRRP